MKAKKKFDPKVIQQFFIEHTEKIVVGLVAVLFVYFAYKSATLQGFATKPPDLTTATKAANDKILKGPDTKTPGTTCPFQPYAVLIDRFKVPLNALQYPMPDILYWKPFAFASPRHTGSVRRRAVAGHSGARAILKWTTPIRPRPANAGSSSPDSYRTRNSWPSFVAGSRARPWPMTRERDDPKYVTYFVQRAEVVPGAAGEPQWQFMVFRGANKAASEWGGKSALEIADLSHVDPQLTSPMPQLVNGTWGPEAVSPPQIPVVEHQNGPAPPVAGQPPIVGGRGTGYQPPPVGGILTPTNAAPSSGDILSGGGPEPGAVKAVDNEKVEEAAVPEYKLVRAIDFDVKPDKKYIYRIFLVLRNPNFGQPATVLEDAELANSKYLGVRGEPVMDTKEKDKIVDWPTDPKKWSKPCTSQRVPDDMRVLGGKVIAAKPPTPPEITAEVRILLWQIKTGLNGSFGSDPQLRGTALNFPDAAVKRPGSQRTTPVDIHTKCILVDIQGGEPVWPSTNRRDIFDAGTILVMDDTGNLVMHDEVTETKEWNDATKEPETPQSRNGDNGRPSDKKKDTGDTPKPPDINSQLNECPRPSWRRSLAKASSMPDYSVRIAGDNLIYSAAHFIMLPGGICEPLHGHNYRVAVEVCGPLGEVDCVIDFLALLEIMKAIVGELDHAVLLPTRHPAIRVVAGEEEVEVRFGPRRWIFPRGECRLLPLVARPLSGWPTSWPSACLRAWPPENFARPQACGSSWKSRLAAGPPAR